VERKNRTTASWCQLTDLPFFYCPQKAKQAGSLPAANIQYQGVKPDERDAH